MLDDPSIENDPAPIMLNEVGSGGQRGYLLKKDLDW